MLSSGIHNIFQIVNAQSRSICAENYKGEKGGGARCLPEDGIAKKAVEGLGLGWKVNPCVLIKAGEVFELADIEGPGMIQQMWFTPTGAWRHSILRIYWDGQEQPSVECPLGDFFCMGWGEYAQLNSLAICVNPGSAFNSYWPMPFKKHCRMTLTNIAKTDCIMFYQINYALMDIPEDAGYFHAQFRRQNPLPFKTDYTLVDGIVGRGQYVGTYMAWGVNNKGWWGEGEVKFFMDGDKEFPTICGTGTEDYFCGSYAFWDPVNKDRYLAFSTPYAGMHQVITPDKLNSSQFRFGLYRWHLTDPIHFAADLKVTMQALGWRADGRYLPLQDDIASVAYWYQTLPTAPFPALPDRDYLEVI